MFACSCSRYPHVIVYSKLEVSKLPLFTITSMYAGLFVRCRERNRVNALINKYLKVMNKHYYKIDSTCSKYCLDTKQEIKRSL